MLPYDSAGRIHKQAFLISSLILFVFSLISGCARFYIRIRVQKHFSIDDGILLFGICCLICAIALLFIFVSKMYLVEATEVGMPGTELPSDFIKQAFDFQKLVAAALILTWCSIVSVKFSYLFLFRKLIDRMRPMLLYWWLATVFNALISVYGAAVYIAACPDFYNLKSLQCAFDKGLQRSIAFSVSQMILDILGDLLILYIPCRLIWKIKIGWIKKTALSFSFCLTILTIICTIARISGINTGQSVKSIDSVWEIYWQFIAANLALTMTAATAFRSLYVSRTKDKVTESTGSMDTWYTKSRQLLRSVFSSPPWQKAKANVNNGDRNSNGAMEFAHYIPRGTMTGVWTFINGNDRTKAGNSQLSQSIIGREYEDSCVNETNAQVINVQQDITLRFDETC